MMTAKVLAVEFHHDTGIEKETGVLGLDIPEVPIGCARYQSFHMFSF
jgi:hypothetical protein